MATELEKSIKEAAAKVATYVNDVSKLTVMTKYVEVSVDDPNNPRIAAKTTIKLDGDCESTVPMKQDSNGELEVDTSLYTIHQDNVMTAIEYRSNIMESLLKVLRQTVA